MLTLFKKKKTSEQWSNQLGYRLNEHIIDPDGWDRQNFDYSWYKEKITEAEFMSRLMRSTCYFASLRDLKGVSDV